MANCIIVEIVKYLSYYWQTHFFFIKIWSLDEEEKRQESEYESWARLDKRIERARTRHELACLVMGTIFLV